MYTIQITNQFKKDVKRCTKRGYPMEILKQAISLLADNGCLPNEYKTHKLSGNREGQWECHLRPDWYWFGSKTTQDLHCYS